MCIPDSCTLLPLLQRKHQASGSSEKVYNGRPPEPRCQAPSVRFWVPSKPRMERRALGSVKMGTLSLQREKPSLPVSGWPLVLLPLPLVRPGPFLVCSLFMLIVKAREQSHRHWRFPQRTQSLRTRVVTGTTQHLTACHLCACGRESPSLSSAPCDTLSCCSG